MNQKITWWWSVELSQLVSLSQVKSLKLVVRPFPPHRRVSQADRSPAAVGTARGKEELQERLLLLGRGEGHYCEHLPKTALNASRGLVSQTLLGTDVLPSSASLRAKGAFLLCPATAKASPSYKGRRVCRSCVSVSHSQSGAGCCLITNSEMEDNNIDPGKE